MTRDLSKFRPYVWYAISCVCIFYSYPFILDNYDFCSSHKVIDSVTFKGHTWELTACQPLKAESQSQRLPNGEIIQDSQNRFYLQSASEMTLHLTGHTARFYGNLSKLDLDQLRLEPATKLNLGLQFSATWFPQPGPRALEVDEDGGQLRVVFGNGRWLAFSPSTSEVEP